MPFLPFVANDVEDNFKVPALVISRWSRRIQAMPHVGVIECIWFDANQFNCEQKFTLDVDAQTATLTARGTHTSPPWPYIVMAANKRKKQRKLLKEQRRYNEVEPVPRNMGRNVALDIRFSLLSF